MVLLTLIARVSDGLPLATSIEGDEQHDHNMVKYVNQAKMLFRKLNAQSPAKCSLESGDNNYMFHYIIQNNVCYLSLTDQSYSAKLAFKFLDDISGEFQNLYGNRVDEAVRPYHFIEFDSYIQTAKRRYGDNRNRYGLGAVNSELQDVQRVMVKNIEDVIHRGEALNILDDKAANLSVMSKKYREDARQLNMRSWLFKIAFIVVVIVFFLLFVRFKFM